MDDGSFILICIIIDSVICGMIGGAIGGRKGIGGVGFFLGLLFGPLGVLLALVAQGKRVNCPFCKELISNAAAVCPRCHKELAGVSDDKPSSDQHLTYAQWEEQAFSKEEAYRHQSKQYLFEKNQEYLVIQPKPSQVEMVSVPIAAEKRYFVMISEEVKGPFTLEQLSALRAVQSVNSNTLCCVEGTESWFALG